MAKPNAEIAKAAFVAASVSLEQKIPATVLARQMNLDRSAVSFARLILQFGTAEEMVAVQSGKLGIRVVADKVRSRMTPEQRISWQTQTPVFTDERRQDHKDDGALWQKLRPAIMGLIELPAPKDMVAVVKRNNIRETNVNQNLATAFKWMEEFVNEWNRSNGGSITSESDDNPGGGSTAA